MTHYDTSSEIDFAECTSDPRAARAAVNPFNELIDAGDALVDVLDAGCSGPGPELERLRRALVIVKGGVL